MSRKSHNLERKQQIKNAEAERKKNNWIQKASLSELHNALAYVEGIANGARQKTGQVHQTFGAYGIKDEGQMDEHLKKLFEIFTEHDDWSFRIEAEMDRRMKPRMGNAYGAEDLLKVGIDIDTVLKDLVKKAEEEKKAAEENKAADDEESNLTVS